MKFDMLNHWFINGNIMGISLMKYYVDIELVSKNDKVMAKLRLNDENMKRLVFMFESLEEAVTFAEDVINKDCYVSIDDIKESYLEYSESVKIKKKYLK